MFKTLSVLLLIPLLLSCESKKDQPQVQQSVTPQQTQQPQDQPKSLSGNIPLFTGNWEVISVETNGDTIRYDPDSVQNLGNNHVGVWKSTLFSTPRNTTNGDYTNLGLNAIYYKLDCVNKASTPLVEVFYDWDGKYLGRYDQVGKSEAFPPGSVGDAIWSKTCNRF